MSNESYRTVQRAAAKLARGYLKRFVRSFLTPIDYTRVQEIPGLLELSGIVSRSQEKLRILDLASPQLLSLSLRLCSEKWEITYLNAHEPELEELRQSCRVAGARGVKLVQGDITDGRLASMLGRFDYIFSCSVFEHIRPEQGGDIAASRQLRSLLAPGGSFLFSVPYYRQGFHEYVTGAVYAYPGAAGEESFFQRFYDEESLYRQIILPSGLRLAAKRYLGERYYRENDIRSRMALLLAPRRRALLLGRLFPLLSSIFMTPHHDVSQLRKPYLALCALCAGSESAETVGASIVGSTASASVPPATGAAG